MIRPMALILAALMLLNMADAAAQAAEVVAIRTTDDSILTGTIIGYESGFLLLEQDERILEISPRHIRAVYASPVEAAAGEERQSMLIQEVLQAAERKYLNDLPDPETRRSDDYFDFLMEEAGAIALAYQQQGREALERRAPELAANVSNATRDPRLFLHPEDYKPVLLFFALVRTRIGETLTSDEPVREKIPDVVGKWRVISNLHRRLEQTVQEADLANEDRQRCLDRLAKLRDRWRLRIPEPLERFSERVDGQERNRRTEREGPLDRLRPADRPRPRGFAPEP